MLTTYNNWLPTMFNDFFGSDWVPASYFKTNNLTSPAVNVLEEEKDYKVEVAAPGMSKNDFCIHIDKNDNLVIMMEKKSETKEGEKKEGKYLRREFSYSKFQQSFTLPDNVEKDKITAKMDNGVLIILLPKKEEKPAAEKHRLIEIQ